ncbi:MAG: molybdopterin-dependent oxidoreductase [Magnetococcales bacterium]|nr:molybdopterin-dependent oxidoreductase [Magnetococcales bacterium]
MSWRFPKLTRRRFIQASSGTAAGMTLMQTPIFSNNSEAEASAKESEEVTQSICNFCSSLCNVQVTSRTEGGVKRIVKLDGNPHSTLNRGKMCARGQAGLRQVYDVDRIKTPLIRVEGSKRGEGRFRAATWEEAWAYIDGKNKKAKIQPWEWTMVGGWTSCVFYMYWAVPFAIANGVPNLIASPMQHCVASGHLGTDSVTGNFNIHDEVLPDYDNANYILFVANNASIGAVSTSRMVRFATGRKRGARVVALDSRVSETAAKADEMILIRPGTDLDFLLAMMHVILEEQLYDAPFLQNHTNMPFLLSKGEDGQWQVAMDEKKQPQVFDEVSREIVSLPAFHNDNRKTVDGQRVVPALSVPVGLTDSAGASVMTVLQAQTAEIMDNTPQAAEKTTGISHHVITRIAREFARAGRPIIDPGWHGARYGNINMLRRVQAMLQGLVGGIDREGGWMMSGEYHHKVGHWIESMKQKKSPGPLMTSMAGVPFVGELVKALSNGKTFPHGKPAWAFAFTAQERKAGRRGVAVPAMADTGLMEAVKGELEYDGEPYRARALIINAANPIRHYYPDTHWKEILTHDNMELVIAIDVLPSDTVPYADVVLPNPTYLERDEPTLYGNGVNHDLMLATRFKAIDPIYDTVETPDILLKMSEIISGTTDNFIGALEQMSGISAKETMTRYAEYKAKGEKSPYSKACRDAAFIAGAKKAHTTPEELEKGLAQRGVYMEQTKEQILDHYAMPRKIPMPTSSGRLEFYSTLMVWLQGGMGGRGPEFNLLAGNIPAQCRENATMADPLEKDEFYFTYGKTPTVSYGSTNSNNPVLAAINRFKRDIYTGVWIHNDRAEALGIVSGDRIRITNVLSGQKAEGEAFVTRQVHSDAIFMHSSFGVENKALRLSHGLGTATNKLIPYFIEPVVAGFRSQEFTVRIEKV